MFWILIIGFTAGALALLPLLTGARRAADRALEEGQRFSRDRERLLEFMHMMTEALGEGLSRPELQQRIVHAAIVCTDALSACIFERTDHETMRGVAVEGLFPPHRPLAEIGTGKLTTRTKFIEQVLMSEEFPVGEGIVGRVAATSRGELLADAASDPDIVRHEDPALKVRSV